jgi:2-haloacid dehalogenase
MEEPMPKLRYDAVVFDLLTALIDSWTLWNNVAGSAEDGLKWRRKYLELTYGQGAYQPYLTIAKAAAVAAGYPAAFADDLDRRWDELPPWPETIPVVTELARHVPLGVATNCSIDLGRRAATRAGGPFKAIVTAEEAGFYKPRPEPYLLVLEKLGVRPERTLFVAGSAADVPGARGVGMDVYWHNRMALTPVDDQRPDYMEKSLQPLLAQVMGT